MYCLGRHCRYMGMCICISSIYSGGKDIDEIVRLSGGRALKTPQRNEKKRKKNTDQHIGQTEKTQN